MALQAAVVGSVGSGHVHSSNIKEIIVHSDVELSKDAYFVINQVPSGYSDRFEFSTKVLSAKSFLLRTRRTDASHGWGQELRVQWRVAGDEDDPQKIAPSIDDTEEARAAAQAVSDCRDTLMDMGVEERLAEFTALHEQGNVASAAAFATQDGLLSMARRLGAAQDWRHRLNISYIDADDLADAWADHTTYPILIPEYEVLYQSISVRPEFMAHSGHVETLRRLRSRNESAVAHDSDSARNIFSQLSSPSETGSQYRIQRCMHFFNLIDHRDRRVLCLCLSFILASTATRLDLLADLIADASNECLARKRWVIGAIVDRCSAVLKEGDAPDTASSESACFIARPQDPPELETSLLILRRAMADFIDEEKERAFKNAILEPTRLYFRLTFNPVMEHDVDVHGSNTYAALLLAALGCRLRHDPLFDDEVKGIVSWLDCAEQLEEQFEQLHRSTALGKSLDAILPSVRLESLRTTAFSGGASLSRRLPRLPSAGEFCMLFAPTPRLLANQAVDPSEAFASQRGRIAQHLEAFVNVFDASSSKLLERMFSFITNATSPDLLGAFQEIHEYVLTQKQGEGSEKLSIDEDEKDVRFFLWSDLESEPTFNRDRAYELFRFVCLK